MIVRPARESDSALLLAWRNDPETRVNSLHQGIVSEADHEAWFAAKRAGSDTEIWVGELDGVPVGQVRLDLEVPGVAVIDIAVAPHLRGQRLGGRLLGLAIDQQTVAAERLRAIVRHENAASLSMFTAAGFVPVDETPEYVVLELTLSVGAG